MQIRIRTSDFSDLHTCSGSETQKVLKSDGLHYSQAASKKVSNDGSQFFLFSGKANVKAQLKLTSSSHPSP